jgi:hypothetical protein
VENFSSSTHRRCHQQRASNRLVPFQLPCWLRTCRFRLRRSGAIEEEDKSSTRALGCHTGPLRRPTTHHRPRRSAATNRFYPLGDVPWETFSLSYDNPPPKSSRPPEWKITEYEVWFRNPREVIKGILSNPELNGHIDYSAYREFEDSQRQYCGMMSGDWAWRQSVVHRLQMCRHH